MMKKVLTLWMIFSFLPLQGQEYEIFVCDAKNFNTPPWAIYKYDKNGQNGKDFITVHIGWPQDILFVNDNMEMLVSNLSLNNIARFNALTGDYLGEFASNILGPTRMLLSQDTLYVIEWDLEGHIQMFSLAGEYLGKFSNTIIERGIGLAMDSLGNIYASSYKNSEVYKFDKAGNLLMTLTSGIQRPTNVVIDPSGHLLVFNYSSGRIAQYDLEGVSLGDFITGAYRAEGYDVTPSGEILIGVGQLSSIHKYDDKGNFIEKLITRGETDLLVPNVVKVRILNPSSIGEEVTGERITEENVGRVFTLVKNIQGHVISQVYVYNALGQVVQQQDTQNQEYLDLGTVSAGVYLLVGKLGNGKYATSKVIVQ